MKLVSILMPVYNCEKYLESAISSILNQTHTNFEIIIINDASTDNSHNIIQSFDDKRIRYFQNYLNKGIIETLNSGLKYCNGSLIARMDGDDLAHIERIEKQVNFFERNKEIGLISSWYLIKDTITSQIKLVRRHADDVKIRFHMLFRNQFLHPGVMMRSNVLKKLRYHQVETCEDYDLWARALNHCKVANCPEILMTYRWHGTNISIINQPKLRKSMIYVISSLLNEYGVEHTHQELLLQVMIALSFNKEQFSLLGKLESLELWLNKLATSESLISRFGSEFLDNELREYKKLYDFN